MSSLFDNPAIIIFIYGWTPYVSTWDSLSTGWICIIKWIIVQTRLCKVVISLLSILKGNPFFILWHFFKYPHIRYKINNFCWSSRYIMQYAFNMLTDAWMYMKVYDEWICVKRVLHCNIANHRELKAKILVYWNKVHLCYLRIKKSYHHYQKKGNGGKGKISDILECDVSMEIVYASSIVQIWSEPSKVQTFNNRAYVERSFLNFVQSMISDFTSTWSGIPILIKIWHV